MPGPRWRGNFKERGHRMTGPRDAILDVVNKKQGHLTADDIFFEVRKSYPGIGIATIYRTLDLFVRMGLVNKFDFGGGKSRYEFASKEKHHHHLVCKNCGRVVDYDSFLDEETELIKKIEAELNRKHDFKIDSHQLDFYGLCKSCQREVK